MEAQDWRAEAACRDMDPEMFSPASYQGPGEAQAQAAKAVCAGCRVAEQCLAGAMGEGDDVTVRGGMTPDERRKLKGRLRLVEAVA